MDNIFELNPILTFPITSPDRDVSRPLEFDHRSPAQDWRTSNYSLPMLDEPRRFYLYRKEDESGVSGIGIVAEGIQFSSGKCVLGWTRQHQSVAIYDNIEALIDIHGHCGKTIILWLDHFLRFRMMRWRIVIRLLRITIRLIIILTIRLIRNIRIITHMKRWYIILRINLRRWRIIII